MDTLVFDIETKNFFTDPGVGWNNYEALKISVVGVYSYLEDRYFCFDENEFLKMTEFFRRAGRLVGFSMNRYDVPVLNYYFQALPEARDIDLWQKERIDLLAEIEMNVGFRISLNKLAAANLGSGKDKHGSEAVKLYRDGKIEELKNYCLGDVRLTKELYDLYRTQGYFLIPDKQTGEISKVEFRAAENQSRLF